MVKYLSVIILSFLFISCGSSKNLLSTYNPFSKYAFDFETYEFGDPIGARRLLRSDTKLRKQYFDFVTQQSATWYLRYFNFNTMSRMGWNNHWQFYNNRFFVWQELLDAPQFWMGFEWNVPTNTQNAFFDLNNPQYDPRQALTENQMGLSAFASTMLEYYDNNATHSHYELEAITKEKNNVSHLENLNSVLQIFQQNNIKLHIIENVDEAHRINAKGRPREPGNYFTNQVRGRESTSGENNGYRSKNTSRNFDRPSQSINTISRISDYNMGQIIHNNEGSSNGGGRASTGGTSTVSTSKKQ